MPQLSHSMLKSKHLEHSSEEEEIELFSGQRIFPVGKLSFKRIA